MFFLALPFGNKLAAQGIQLTKSDHPFLYISSAYTRTSTFSEGTSDPFYETSSTNTYPDRTVRADLGLQINNNVSFEVGYIRTPLWLTNKLTFDDDLPLLGSGGSGSSYTRISFYSIKLKNSFSLWKNIIQLKSGLGYALGNSDVRVQTIGPSEPRTFTIDSHTISTSSTLTGLHNGNSHFITFDLGLELSIHKKISLFANVSYYRGFTDLQQEFIEYTIDGTKGSFTTVTDGSFLGRELGLKYNFR